MSRHEWLFMDWYVADSVWVAGGPLHGLGGSGPLLRMAGMSPIFNQFYLHTYVMYILWFFCIFLPFNLYLKHFKTQYQINQTRVYIVNTNFLPLRFINFLLNIVSRSPSSSHCLLVVMPSLNQTAPSDETIQNVKKKSEQAIFWLWWIQMQYIMLFKAEQIQWQI